MSGISSAQGLALGAALSCVACGGGQPLLHPAHPLPPGVVTVGAGLSGRFAVGSVHTAIRDARDTPENPAGAESDDTRRRGALAEAAIAPGVAPWVGVRAGVAKQTEAGLTYTGRSVRVDGRYALVFGSTALSAGLGATGVLLQPGSSDDVTETPETSGQIRGVDTRNVTGWGLDLPIIYGWRSDADLVRIWGGGRAGYERLFGDVYIASGAPEPEATAGEAEVNHWYFGGLAGLAVGLGPVWAAAEIAVAYESLTGDYRQGDTTTDAELRGVSLTPGAALFTKF